MSIDLYYIYIYLKVKIEQFIDYLYDILGLEKSPEYKPPAKKIQEQEEERRKRYSTPEYKPPERKVPYRKRRPIAME